MNRNLIKIGIIVSMSALSGCATLSGGTAKQEITFDTTPQGAVVYGDKGELGKTPLTVGISPGDTGIFRIKKEGYKQEVVHLKKVVKKSSYANAILFPLWPVTSMVDEVTNARYKFDDNEVKVTLLPLKDKDAA